MSPQFPLLVLIVHVTAAVLIRKELILMGEGRSHRVHKEKCADLLLKCVGVGYLHLHVMLGRSSSVHFLQVSQLLYLCITFEVSLSLVSCWIQSMSELFTHFTRNRM